VIFRAVVLCLVLARGLLAGTDPRAFEDKKQGIRLYLPEGWGLDTSAREPGMVLAAVGKSPAGGEARIDLSVSPAVDDLSGQTPAEVLEEFVQQLEEQAFSKKENYKMVLKQPQAIGRGSTVDAVSMEITYREAGVNARDHWVCFFHRRRVYSFRTTCYTRASEGATAKKHGCDRLEEAFMLFVASLELTRADWGSRGKKTIESPVNEK
jgi:hypothetical protein